jgi:hypothetical protein
MFACFNLPFRLKMFLISGLFLINWPTPTLANVDPCEKLTLAECSKHFF